MDASFWQLTMLNLQSLNKISALRWFFVNFVFFSSFLFSVCRSANRANEQKVQSNMKILRPLFTKCRPFLYSFLFLATIVLFFSLICFYINALEFLLDLLSKVGVSLGGRALCSFVIKMGCPAGLALAMGFAVRALLTGDANPSLAHWMLPGPSHQPHVAEEVPQDALRNEHQPVANRSDPLLGDDEVKQPLMVDQQRQMELENRLNRHFIGKPTEINTIASFDLIEKQLLI